MNRFLISLILTIFTVPAIAADVVGSVILSFGQNTAVAEDGAERVLKRQSDIYASDLLKTGAKGRLQVRFSDGSRLALKPSTEFRIAEYQFDKAEPDEGKAIYQLLKGGMRTISGQIGKKTRENYRLETTVATIGIRGTHYGVQYIPEGIYTETVDGIIAVKTQREEILLKAGRGALVRAADGEIDEGQATGQTGESEPLNPAPDNTQNEADDVEGGSEPEPAQEIDDDGVITEGDQIPATDPALDGTTTPPVEAPDPTGQGSAAAAGAMTAVAFTEYESSRGLRGGSGSVLVNSNSAITVDNSTGTGDLVTGIYYVDPNPNTGGSCAPCVFTGGDNVGLITGVGNLTLGGSKLTWGRWNSGFSLNENDQTQELSGSFHFMFTDSLTTQSQLDAVAAARSGSYLYVHAGGSKLTAPEIDNGNTGSLVSFGSGGVPSGRLYAGTYVLVNWDTQVLEQISILADVNDGTGTRNYHLTEETNASTGTGVQTSMADVLNGGELKLAGTCSGGQCTYGGNDTTLSGNMSFDFVGSQAEGAITSYSASGDSPEGIDITVTGTVLLENNGPGT